MLYGSMAAVEASGYFTKRTANAAATDFRHHKIGYDYKAEEIVIADPGRLILSLEGGGQISGKRQKFVTTVGTAQQSTAAFAMWPLENHDEAELLALVQPMTWPMHSSNSSFGLGLRARGPTGTDVSIISVLFHRGSGTARELTVRSVRTGNSSNDSRWLVNGWTEGSLYWLRMRLGTTRLVRVKVWPFGSAEPGAWTFTPSSIPDSKWPPAEGRLGAYIPMGAQVRETFIHYLAAGYNGAAAPLPWETPT